MMNTEKPEAQKKADAIRRKNVVGWFGHPNVELVATMQDADGDFFVAVGVKVLEAGPKLPKEIDGVPINKLHERDVSLPNGATDISFALTIS